MLNSERCHAQVFAVVMIQVAQTLGSSLCQQVHNLLRHSTQTDYIITPGGTPGDLSRQDCPKVRNKLTQNHRWLYCQYIFTAIIHDSYVLMGLVCVHCNVYPIEVTVISAIVNYAKQPIPNPTHSPPHSFDKICALLLTASNSKVNQ